MGFAKPCQIDQIIDESSLNFELEIHENEVLHLNNPGYLGLNPAKSEAPEIFAVNLLSKIADYQGSCFVEFPGNNDISQKKLKLVLLFINWLQSRVFEYHENNHQNCCLVQLKIVANCPKRGEKSIPKQMNSLCNRALLHPKIISLAAAVIQDLVQKI